LTFLDRFSRTVRGRSRTVSRPLAVVGVVALALTPLAATAQAGAAETRAAQPAAPATVILFSGDATFHVGGHTWLVSVLASDGFTGLGASTTHEFDSWGFLSVPSSDLKVNASTGAATFSAHSSLAPVAFAKLRFTPTSRHKASCSSGSETDFNGRSTGSITLVASSTVKFKSARVTFTGGSVSVDHGCVQAAGNACIAGSWNLGANSPTVFGNTPGLPTRQKYTVDVIKSVNLKAPKNANVTFDVVGTASKPVFASKAKRLSVKASGVVKGSAVIVATHAPSVTNSHCTLNHKRYAAHDVTYFLAKYSSPAGGEFHTRSLIGGLIKVSRRGSGSFDIMTFKAG